MTRSEFRPDPQVLIQKLPEGEAVLLHMGTEVYFGLNPTGARFWEVLVETGDTETAIGPLLAEFEVDEVRLRSDLHDLIGKWTEAGLLAVADE